MARVLLSKFLHDVLNCLSPEQLTVGLKLINDYPNYFIGLACFLLPHHIVKQNKFGNIIVHIM